MKNVVARNNHDKDALIIRYKREFEVALIKICLAASGIGFFAGIIATAILVTIGR